MSQYYGQHGKPYTPTYKDGRTKQSFKDECDINRILNRAQKTGTISHLANRGGEYGDFSSFDFFDAQTKLAKAREIFDELPSEMRREFENTPAKFFEFCNDPANVDRLAEVLPAIAEPGRYFPPIKKTAANQAASEPKESVSKPIDKGDGTTPKPEAEKPPEGKPAPLQA